MKPVNDKLGFTTFLAGETQKMVLAHADLSQLIAHALSYILVVHEIVKGLCKQTHSCHSHSWSLVRSLLGVFSQDLAKLIKRLKIAGLYKFICQVMDHTQLLFSPFKECSVCLVFCGFAVFFGKFEDFLFDPFF